MEKHKIILTAATGFYIFFFLSLFFLQVSGISFTQDDQYISLRYAKNLETGNGLVFNSNDFTEGYTSYLWVILLACALKLNLNPEQFSSFMSAAAGAGVMMLSYILCRLILRRIYCRAGDRRNYPAELFPLLVFPFFAFNAAFVYWSASGMEETLFIFILLASFFLYFKYLDENRFHFHFIAVSFIACLTRPEGFILVSFIVAAKIFYIKKRLSLSLKPFIPELSVFMAVFLIILFHRLAYYGYILPNTIYAKAGFTSFHLKRGFFYLTSFINTNLLYGSFLLIPLVWAIIRKEKFLLITCLYVLIFCFIVTIVGGDVLPLHRLLLPMLPLIYISFIIFLILSARTIINKIVYYLLLSGFIVSLFFFSYLPEKTHALECRNYETGLVAKMKEYALYIKQKPGASGKVPTVALSTIGAFSFYSDVKVIDLAGLTDKYTAHNPKATPGITDNFPVFWKERTYNAEYVIKQNPDYIIFPAGSKPSAFPECALFVQPEFFTNYYTEIIYSERLNEYLPIFSKRPEKLKTNSSLKWDNSFAANYINAINLFLTLTKTGNAGLLTKIESEIDTMLKKCPQRKSEATTILGYANYHLKKYDNAEKLFKEALKDDDRNSSALLYLKNIALLKKDTSAAINYLVRLKRVSPAALPYLEN